MTIERSVERARTIFEREGVEGLSELANSEEFRVACVRVFLSNWADLLNEIDSWAHQLVDCCELLLPASICDYRLSTLYEEITVFSINHAEEIKKQVRLYPNHFSLPNLSTVTIEKAIYDQKADTKSFREFAVVGALCVDGVPSCASPCYAQ